MHSRLLFIHSNSAEFDTQNPSSISIILAAFKWPRMDSSAIVTESFVAVALQFCHLQSCTCILLCRTRVFCIPAWKTSAESTKFLIWTRLVGRSLGGRFDCIKDSFKALYIAPVDIGTKRGETMKTCKTKLTENKTQIKWMLGHCICCLVLSRLHLLEVGDLW